MSSLAIGSSRFQTLQRQWGTAKRVLRGPIDPRGIVFQIRIYRQIDQTASFFHGERLKVDIDEQDLWLCTVISESPKLPYQEKTA